MVSHRPFSDRLQYMAEQSPIWQEIFTVHFQWGESLTICNSITISNKQPANLKYLICALTCGPIE